MAERPRTSHQGRGRKAKVGPVKDESTIQAEALEFQVMSSGPVLSDNSDEDVPVQTLQTVDHFPEAETSLDIETLPEQNDITSDSQPIEGMVLVNEAIEDPTQSLASQGVEEIDQQNMVEKFAEKVKKWDISNSKPIDMFKQGSWQRPWTSGGMVQPALEMTQRPGSAPHRKNKVLPLIESGTLTKEIKETSAEDVEQIEHQQEAWAKIQDGDIPIPPKDGLAFQNSSAEQLFPSRPAWSEGVARHSSISSKQGSIAEGMNERQSARSNSVRSSVRGPQLQSTQPQAYIPYEVAKRNMNRVIEDMKLMKKDHFTAISEVGRIYKEIEDETQKTFNEFVKELRDDYKEKVRAFTNIIEICLSDSNRKEEHWKLQAGSLKECNIKLVGEVNELVEYTKKMKDELQRDNKRDIAQLRRAMTEERRQLLIHLQARENTLKDGYAEHIESLKKGYKRKIEIIISQHQSNMTLREGVYSSQFATKSQQNEEELLAMKEQHERSLEHMTVEEKKKIAKLKEEEEATLSKMRSEENARLEKLQKEKEEEINRLSLEKESLEEEWKAERALIKEEFEHKIGSLNETISGSEEQIKVHEDALAEYKSKVETDMIEFEEKRKEEISKIQNVGDDERNKLMEDLEATKKLTERKMRSSLAGIKFHESQKQLLLGRVDQAEHALRVAEVEQEEAEAGATYEKNQRLAVVKSEEEAKEAELEVIRSESRISAEPSAVTQAAQEFEVPAEDIPNVPEAIADVVETIFAGVPEVNASADKPIVKGAESVSDALEAADISEGAENAEIGNAAGVTDSVIVNTDHSRMKGDEENNDGEIAELRALCKKQEKENNKLRKELEKQNNTVISLQNNIATLSAQSQAHKARSEGLEQHLASVLAESCEDEKQRKHNNKRLAAKQAELSSLEEKKEALERELEEWKEKVEEGAGSDELDSTFGAYVTSKQVELDQLEEEFSETKKSVTALTLLTDGEIGVDVLPEVKSDSLDLTSEVPVSVAASVTIEENEEEREKREEEEEEKRIHLEEMSREIDDLKEEIDDLTEEVDNITTTKDNAERQVTEIKGHNEVLQMKITTLEETVKTFDEQIKLLKSENDLSLANEQRLVQANKEANEAELGVKSDIIAQLRNQLTDLEAEKLAQLPADAQETIQTYRDRLTLLEEEMESMDKLKVQLELSVNIEKTNAATLKEGLERATKSTEESNGKLAALKEEKKKEIEALLARCQAAEKVKGAEESSDSSGNKLKVKQLSSENKKLTNQLTKLKDQLEAKASDLKDSKKALKDAKEAAKDLVPKGSAGAAAAPVKKGPAAKPAGASDAQVKALKDKIETFKKAAEANEGEVVELKKKLRTAESEAKKAQDAVKNNKDTKKLELTKKVLDETKGKLAKSEEMLADLEKDHDKLKAELADLNKQLTQVSAIAKEAEELKEQNEEMTRDLKKLRAEYAEVVENYNSERILRKKYYNQIEDMKGKIRVYCRARPLSGTERERGNHSVILSPDEYTVQVQTKRGMREFQFDQVYTPDTRGSQENVFEDVKMLVQSAVDGYNVCIFAYGQTGSGKTFTMIGESSGDLPGIAPKGFREIFELLETNAKKFSYTVQVYMVELYNDSLLDLFDSSHSSKLDIKKDKKGMVVIQGAVIKGAGNSTELMQRFTEGSKNRHVACTKMNAESSRSHLIIGIVIETTNLTTGTILRGKLSLVDLAGSERAAKTGATPEQLKEAQSINKSLSALGDVIQALSTEQNFIPYRNNKLTMLMQDSIGGNAKTLMFVNISPADYNTDETIVSLGYAARVKLITNDASKNADNKEIARLKSIISKLKKGESIDDDDD